uniref:DUF4911 domain-containing protein n=1 Tax=Caldimicrobium thiodismutans TaxID=1653476 RepID=A0A832LWE4_9BACT
MRSTQIVFCLNPSKIAFLKFVLEGYDHLANLTVLNPKRALLKISFYPTEEKRIKEILADFEVEFTEAH